MSKKTDTFVSFLDRSWIAPLSGFGAALTLGLALWGFTVDDALITCRYAHHVASGEGYVFNRGGPSTDGVTPLGYPYLLAPFARRGALGALEAAKWIALVAHALGALFVCRAVQRTGGTSWRWCGPAVWLVSAPAVAWSASGMETGLVSGLVAIGASLRVIGRADLVAVLVLGVAAGLRPELLPLVVVLAMPRAAASSAWAGAKDTDGSGPVQRAGLDARSWLRLALVATPFAVAAITRTIAFGRPAPLSASAKPSDPILGLKYALACAILTGVVALCAPIALRAAPRFARWLVVAVVVHSAAVAFAGGDWMPVSRLYVPLLPVIALAVATLAPHSRPRWIAGRAALALAGVAFAWFRVGPQLLRVAADRGALIEQMRGPLADRRVVAGIDVGWLGAAAPHATIVDLAGVTDPQIAALPGRHIEKKIPDGLLAERGTDALVLQLYKETPLAEPWPRSSFARGIEVYIAGERALEGSFEPTFVSEGRLRYVVLKKRAGE